MNQDLSILQLVLGRQLGGAAGDAAAGGRVHRQLGRHLPQAVRAVAREVAQRRVRARLLVRHQPERPVRAAAQNAKLAGPMERIFASGMREYQKLRERRIADAATLLDGARRAMRASYQRELDVVESTCPSWPRSARCRPTSACSARCGASCTPSPAWPALQQVTLATVAPGIAEALVATAIGLFAAIPAVVAYNRFARDIDRVAIKLETFIEEFSNILQRNLAAQCRRRPAASRF
jgi:biopolymer transport protein TolQ